MSFNLKQEILRKLIHLSSFWIVALIWGLPRLWSILILGFVSVFVLIAEYETYKRKNSLCARIYMTLCGRILRDKEKSSSFHFSGAPYVLISALILDIVFPKLVAMFALCVLLISDTMAALIGRRFGKHKLLDHKTLEGTLAFIGSGLLVALLFVWVFHFDVKLSFVAVLLGCLGDLFNEKLHVDDNLSIPLLTALPFLF